MKIASRAIVASLFVLAASVFTQAQSSPDRIWTAVDESRVVGRSAERQLSPSRYRVFRLDKSIVTRVLDGAPAEFSQPRGFARAVLSLPMPDGSFGRFEIEHSLVVEPALVEKYPELGRTYTGRGVDDTTAPGRLDLLPRGFHAMVLTPRGTIMVDPYSADDTDHYLSYFKRDVERSSEWACEFEEIEFVDKLFHPTGETDLIPGTSENQVTSGTQLRTYRLALAGNWEYCNVAGGNTVAGCLAAMVTVMARVNGVYERDLSMRMVMVANNNLIAYAGDNMTCPVGTGGTACTSANDPYANSSSALNQNTTNLNTVIGVGNYDIGHVFTTGSGGVANLGVPCGTNPGGGTTGLGNPFGDPFSIDYVAHEMGHQWGANHTFNGATSNCGGGNRSSASAYEPGSGITIMAYAGICGTQNLAANSIDTFHVRSLEAIANFSQNGNGNACAVTTATGNTPPAVSIAGGPSWNIPKQTPFTLTANASDANGDSITYDWQEYDLGSSTTAVPNTDSDGVARPIFRPFLPTSGPSRTFPALQHILSTANVPPSTTGGFLTGELLPAISRTMTFQVVARDNRGGGGGINTAAATVVVNGASGPFAVTAPNTGVSWAGNSPQTVTWNVANTNNSPINTTHVRILFSTDGGQTFPIVISNSTANDGSEVITLPDAATTTGRIKIEAVGNIYFDISDVNFIVTTGIASVVKSPFDFDGDSKTDISIYRPSNGQWWLNQSSSGNTFALQFGNSTDVIAPADYTGDGSSDIAIFRPSDGNWYVLRSEDFSFFAFPFGTTGDIPVPADFDGDQKADPAVFRPSTGGWFINRSTGGTTIAVFGSAGDKPVPADFDGDNKADLAIYRPSAGQWWLQQTSDSVARVFQFGSPTDDLPITGRFTADNKADAVIYRPSTGQWFILRSEDGSYYGVPFGSFGDLPVPGDYDGDGRFDTAVFRPSNSSWYVDRTTTGVMIMQFGAGTDKPAPNAYVR